jgi:hypothetical protein
LKSHEHQTIMLAQMARLRSRSLARRSAALPLALLARSIPAAAAPKPAHGAFEALQPGEFVTHVLDVPVRIVAIGLEDGSIDEATRAPKAGCRPRQAPQELPPAP